VKRIKPQPRCEDARQVHNLRVCADARYCFQKAVCLPYRQGLGEMFSMLNWLINHIYPKLLRQRAAPCITALRKPLSLLSPSSHRGLGDVAWLSACLAIRHSERDAAMEEAGCSFSCCHRIPVDCNVRVLCIVKGLLLGGGLQGVLKQLLGGSPSCRQKIQHHAWSYCGIQLQLGWCHFLESVFAGTYLFLCLYLFLSHI